MPKHFNLNEAKDFIDSFKWTEEFQSYHHGCLTRYLTTLDRLFGMPRNTKVLEIGGAPYGMTVMMLKYLFDNIETVSFGGKDKEASDMAREESIVFESATAGRFSFTEKYFNIESDRWPYRDESFDLIVSCEIFEHLALDPMYAMSEANRVLRPGGRMLMTVPNVLSLRNVMAIISGGQPSIFPFYRPMSVNWRHNREWTPAELEALFYAAGFDLESIETINVYPWNQETYSTALGVSASGCLRLAGNRVAERGEIIIGTARKNCPVRTRYPTQCDLYYRVDVAQLTAKDEMAR
jgi:SAM-dependent methyltransferase